MAWSRAEVEHELPRWARAWRSATSRAHVAAGDALRRRSTNGLPQIVRRVEREARLLRERLLPEP